MRPSPAAPHPAPAGAAAAGAFQSVFASASFRNEPRYSRVAVDPPDTAAEDVWRGEVRLLFRAWRPPAAGGTNAPEDKEDLMLIKYFEPLKDGKTPMPPSILSHAWAPPPAHSGAGGASGSGRGGGGAAAGGRRTMTPRQQGERLTGAVRLRFVPPQKQLRARMAVLPVTAIVRVEHVLPDFHQAGLDGGFPSFYVNPWKWSLENVADDEARGLQLDAADV